MTREKTKIRPNGKAKRPNDQNCERKADERERMFFFAVHCGRLFAKLAPTIYFALHTADGTGCLDSGANLIGGKQKYSKYEILENYLHQIYSC